MCIHALDVVGIFVTECVWYSTIVVPLMSKNSNYIDDSTIHSVNRPALIIKQNTYDIRTSE